LDLERYRLLVAKAAFDSVMPGVILFNAFILGAETYGDLRGNYQRQFDFLNNLILGISPTL
jgi:hypothetical protein